MNNRPGMANLYQSVDNNTINWDFKFGDVNRASDGYDLNLREIQVRDLTYHLVR